MGVKLLPIVVYTHTDMKDVWVPFFGQLKKYMPNNEVYVCVNQDDEMLSDYNRVIYDETKSYTEKLAESLEQINEEVFLFTHEDMILFDKLTIYEYYKFSTLTNFAGDPTHNSFGGISFVTRLPAPIIEFSPIVTPGGAKESIMTDPKKETLVINKRKGFIELAIVHGLPIVPVYAFGINKVYKTSNLFEKFLALVVSPCDQSLNCCFPINFFISVTIWVAIPFNRKSG